MKLKIGIIQQTPDIGGAETYMLSLISRFLEDKNEVHFATNHEKFMALVKKLNVHLYKIPLILDIIGNIRGLIKGFIFFSVILIFYIHLLSKFKKNGVSVILMSGFSEKMLVTFLSPFYSIAVVWIEYAPLTIIFKRNFGIPKILYGWLCKKCYRIIVPTEITRKSLMSDISNISSLKITVIPCGVKFSKNLYPKKTKKQKFIIGNVSRLTKEKGQQYLIQAMPCILAEIPNAELFIIGQGPDKDYFKNLINDLNLNDNVKMFGFVKDPSYYYLQMDVFVFPTVWNLEGFGLVTAEAMSYKIPVVAANIGPVPEIIENEKTGLLVSPRNEQAIAQAVIRIYKNEELREKIAVNGFKKAKKYYNLDKVSKEILTVLTS